MINFWNFLLAILTSQMIWPVLIFAVLTLGDPDLLDAVTKLVFSYAN